MIMTTEKNNKETKHTFRINSQTSNILELLQRGEKITPLKALKLFGSFRLSSIIFSLKKRGYNITTEVKTDNEGRRFAEYCLTSTTNN